MRPDNHTHHKASRPNSWRQVFVANQEALLEFFRSRNVPSGHEYTLLHELYLNIGILSAEPKRHIRRADLFVQATELVQETDAEQDDVTFTTIPIARSAAAR